MAQNWHFWLIWARPCRFFRCPVVGRLVVVARAVSRKTPIYFIIIIIILCIVIHDVLQTNLQTEKGEILYQTLSLAARVHSADLETR